MNFLIYGKFDFLFYECKDRDKVRKKISITGQKDKTQQRDRR
jgi:hypothetical protein